MDKEESGCKKLAENVKLNLNHYQSADLPDPDFITSPGKPSWAA